MCGTYLKIIITGRSVPWQSVYCGMTEGEAVGPSLTQAASKTLAGALLTLHSQGHMFLQILQK